MVRRSDRLSERGDVMVWVVVSAPFLLAGLSALVSGSQRWQAQREVTAVAGAAARAGAQPDPFLLRVDGESSMDQRARAADRSRQRALAVVAEEPGSTAVTEFVVDTDRVTVEVRATVDYAMPAFGLPTTVTGRASAVAVEALDGP